jgi:NADH-quinone oxidoreductase subunit N
MSVAVKAAGFAVFARTLVTAFGGLHGVDRVVAATAEGLGGTLAAARSHGWYGPVQLCAVLTMILGNTAAIPQRNVKRMLAYSGIAHAGYLLVGLCSLISIAGTDAAAAIQYYLLAYGAANLGAFAVVIAVGRPGDERQDVDEWAGLGRRKPLVALAMTVCMASLVGIPPTAGFFAKFYLFKAAIAAGLVNLAVLGVVTSVAGVYYYLRIVVSMYMKDAPVEPPGAPHSVAGAADDTSIATYVALALAIAGVLYLGVFPDRALSMAVEGAHALLGR